jgi:hypothetical protein
MIKNERPSGELLFEEHVPEFIPNMNLQTHSQVIFAVWSFRAIYIITLFLIMIIVTGDSVNDVKIVAVGPGGLGVILAVLATEWLMRKPRIASVPVRLYSNHIKMHVFPYERLLGFNGCISVDEIERIEIVRGSMKQRINRQYRYIQWEDAPIRYEVITKNGKRHSSGLKPPGQVIAITDIIKERWNVPIIDPGQGVGKMIEYNKGIPVL